jgi:predicted  nucleic acid-binding Zn-ribbon protein
MNTCDNHGTNILVVYDGTVIKNHMRYDNNVCPVCKEIEELNQQIKDLNEDFANKCEELAHAQEEILALNNKIDLLENNIDDAFNDQGGLTE